MKKILLVVMIAMLSACVKAGEFSSKTHALYEMGKPDCEKMPERCHKGVPW